jgi:hypothetical protein
MAKQMLRAVVGAFCAAWCGLAAGQSAAFTIGFDDRTDTVLANTDLLAPTFSFIGGSTEQLLVSGFATGVVQPATQGLISLLHEPGPTLEVSDTIVVQITATDPNSGLTLVQAAWLSDDDVTPNINAAVVLFPDETGALQNITTFIDFATGGFASLPTWLSIVGVSDVPEPGTALVLGSSLVGLSLLRRRTRR